MRWQLTISKEATALSKTMATFLQPSQVMLFTLPLI
jgi:hypothetical protein